MDGEEKCELSLWRKRSRREKNSKEMEGEKQKMWKEEWRGRG